VTMFMRYVHNEDDPIRAAAETVAQRRQTLIEAVSPQISSAGSEAVGLSPTPLASLSEVTISKRPILDDGQNTSCAKLGNYRPFRHRAGENRAIPPGTKRASGTR